MPLSWRAAPEVFSEALRRHGQQPGAVTDVEAAWRAFGEFLQTGFDGLADDADADGFIVQWGRYSWNGGRISLSFTRQFTVAEGHALWQVELKLCFGDEPELLGIERLEAADTGFCFDPVGPKRIAGIIGALTEVRRYPQLRATWRATPVSSDLTLTRV
jgi:hypothetical protein